MSEFPHELIRQVQICSREAAGLPDYNPFDPTLPALPSLSAAIAAFEPSPPELRCNNCKGRLLRGLDSIICIYCGQAPQNDASPDPICFTSSFGYQWLLHSLHLDGSEMVEPVTNKTEQNQGQSSPKGLIPLSDFLNFKIPWKPEVEKQETSVSDEHSEQSKRSLILPGMAPDNFLFKSKMDVLSDIATEQPFMHNQISTAGNKDIATLDNQNLFQNNQSSEPAENSYKDKSSEAFSGWEADFQSADSGEQHISDESFGHFAGPTPDFEKKIMDSQPFDNLDSQSFGDFTGPTPDSDNKMKQVQSFDNPDSQSFGHFSGPTPDSDNKIKEVQSFDNPDLQSFGDFTGPTPDSDNKIEQVQSFDNPESGNEFWDSRSIDHSTGLEVDLASHLDSVFGPGKDLTDEKPKENREASPPFDDWNSDDVWNNLSGGSHFTKGNDATISSNDGNILEQSKELYSGADLFQDFQWQTNTAEMTANKTTNEDSFGEWNDFTGSTSVQVTSSNDWIGSDYHVPASDKKSSEIDLFGLDNKFEERDFGDFTQPDLFSTSTRNDNIITEVVAVSSENPASKWLSDTAIEFGQSSEIEDDTGKSTKAKDDVAMLISQMHDLSFMLDSNLHIPSTSNAHNSSPKD